MTRAHKPYDAALPEWGVGRRLHGCHRAFITELQARLALHKVSFSEWMHLRTLYEEDGIAQFVLSQRLGIEKASSTAVLDSLHERRLIRRVRDSRDGRRILVFLTERGHALLAKLIALATDMNGVARRGIDQRDFAAFLKVLDAMTDNLLAHRSAGSASPATDT